jgi:hypothetical protein
VREAHLESQLPGFSERFTCLNSTPGVTNVTRIAPVKRHLSPARRMRAFGNSDSSFSGLSLRCKMFEEMRFSTASR